MSKKLNYLSLSLTVAVFSCVTASAATKSDKTKPAAAPAAVDPYAEVQPAVEKIDLDAYQRIRDEGLNHSHVMEFAGALSDGIGQRLTGSPNLMKANDWTRDTLTKIGLENAHLEDWGEFGMGWQQLNTWARMVTPDTAILIVQATPWSPATEGPVTGDVVFVNIKDDGDFDKYKGRPERLFSSAPCGRFRQSIKRSLSAPPISNSKKLRSSRSARIRAECRPRCKPAFAPVLSA